MFYFGKAWFSWAVYLLLFVLACRESGREVRPAFYHWRTALDLSSIEKDYLQKLSVQQLYIKFFDVDWDFNQKEPVALASLEPKTTLPENIAIVPTIFIANRTLDHLPEADLPSLAHKIIQKLFRQKKAFPKAKNPGVSI